MDYNRHINELRQLAERFADLLRQSQRLDAPLPFVIARVDLLKDWEDWKNGDAIKGGQRPVAKGEGRRGGTGV